MTIKQQGGVFGRHPEFSSVEIDGVGTIQKNGTKLNITAAGGVEIDGSQLFDLLVNGGVQINDERLRVLLTGNTSYAEIGVDYTSAYLRSTYSSGGTSDFRFLHNSSEIMRITGSGITFNGDTAAANALDDYEEGTWTPVPADAETGGNTGTASGSAVGNYTKIGNVVHVTCALTNVDTTGLTAGNLFYIQGLPFSSKDLVGASAYYISGGVLTNAVTITGNVQMYLGDLSKTAVGFYDAGGNILVSDLTSAVADFYFSLTYMAA